MKMYVLWDPKLQYLPLFLIFWREFADFLKEIGSGPDTF